MYEIQPNRERLVQEFDNNGFVSIPRFLDPSQLAEANVHVERFIEDVVPRLPVEIVYYEDKRDPSTLKQIQKLFEHGSFFDELMFQSRFEELAEVLLGEEVVGKNMQYFNKPPRIGKPTPPHQDGFFLMLEPNHAITIWLALEDVDVEQGCVRYVRGSHKHGMRPHGKSDVLGFSQQILDFGTTLDRENAVACPCKAGHLIAHHSLTVHWAEGNTSDEKTRKALGFIYYGASAKQNEEAHAEYQRNLAKERAAQGVI